MNINELEKLREQMEDSKNKFDESFVNFAVDNCGYKVGDVVEITGTSFRGKKMLVKAILGRFDNWKGEYFAVLHGHVLKNDGTESKNRVENKISLGCVR